MWVLFLDVSFFLSKIILFDIGVVISYEYFSTDHLKCVQSIQEFQFYIYLFIFFIQLPYFVIILKNMKKMRTGLYCLN